MVDVNASITTSVSESASVTTSVDRDVSVTTSVDRDVSVPAEIDTATSPYADVTATNPDLLVPMLYASTAVDGQILYEDSGLTTPVDAAGDPIGGVTFGGTKRAEQTADSERPIFQGDGAGVIGDGSSQQLDVIGNVAHESLFFAFQVDIQNFDTISYHWGTSYADGPVGCYASTSGDLVFSWRDASGSFVAAGVDATLGRHVVLCELTAANTLNLYIDDPSTPAASTSGADGDSETPSATTILSRLGFAKANDIVGIWTAYEGAKTTAERTAIHDALADGWMP